MSATKMFSRHRGWGTPNRFTCAACKEDGSDIGGTVPSSPGVTSHGVVVCRSCWTRMAVDESFKEQVKKEAPQFFRYVLMEKVADVIGVTGQRMLEALPNAGPNWVTIDQALGLPKGTAIAALDAVLAGLAPHMTAIRLPGTDAAQPKRKTPEPTEVNPSALDTRKSTPFRGEMKAAAFRHIGRGG